MSDVHSNRDRIALSGHRHWAGLWTGVAAMGAASGVAMVSGGAWAGWFLVIVFGPSAVVLGLSLRPQANELVIDRGGYSVGSTFRRYTVPWSSVERIGAIDGVRERRVAIRLTPAAAANEQDAAAIAQALGGYHRTLPMTYGADADELAALMRSFAGLGDGQASSTTSE